jgi:hypothetical protein
MDKPNDGFPGATLWWKFDDACKDAEAEFGQAVKEAATERDQILKAPCQWAAPASVKAAAEARYNRKRQAAQAKRDERYRRAEEELFKGLDEREREDVTTQKARMRRHVGGSSRLDPFSGDLLRNGATAEQDQCVADA